MALLRGLHMKHKGATDSGGAADAAWHPHLEMYCAALDACEKAAQWKRSLALLQEMKEARAQLNEIAYATAIAACVATEAIGQSMALVTEMMALWLMPQSHTFAALLSEQSRRRSTREVVGLVLTMRTTCFGRELDGALSNGAALTILSELLQPDEAAVRQEVKSSPEEVKQPFAGLMASRQSRWLAFAVQQGSCIAAPERHRRRFPRNRPYAKEIELLEFVLNFAEPANPASVCEAFERFGNEMLVRRAWLKVVGNEKADVIATALRHATGRGKILEIGTYCGYSALKMAMATDCKVPILSIEADPVHAIMARNLIAFAGLQGLVHVLMGHSKDVLFREVAKEAHPFRFVFMDQRGSRYDEDRSTLESLGVVGIGSVLVADNILKPGAPAFLWKLLNTSGIDTKIVSVSEFAMPAEDWMTVSVYTDSEQRLRATPPPAAIARLERDSERMRELAFDSSQSVTFREWGGFAARMKRELQRLGITPTVVLQRAEALQEEKKLGK